MAPDVLVIPFPAQGHINPALWFATCLASHGLRVTLVTTTRVRSSATVSLQASVSIDDISDGSEDVNPDSETVEEYFLRFREAVSKNLSELIDGYGGSVKAIVYDSTMPWVLDIAHGCGLRGASFFTQNCGVCAVYWRLKGMRYPYEEGVEVALPGLPPLGVEDLPYFEAFPDEKHTVMRLLVDQFSNLESADSVLFNTFYQLESEIVDWMTTQWPVKTVGPTFALLKRDEKHLNNKNHMINLFEPKHEACEKWLNSKEMNSVVYVSFGSLVTLKKEQMEEVARGLLMSDQCFLWVVRNSEREKLPENFDSMASEKGLIVDWCHQTRVLAHDVVSCFMTHCGWNSTLEALTYGVPLIAMGQWVDQTTNSKLVEDVWKVGIRVTVGDDGVVGREEIASCIQQIAQSDRGLEIKKNASKWKELANEAVEKGGTSANNIEDFVSKLRR